MKKYFAHTGENPDKSDWEPLEDHLHNTAKTAKFHGSKISDEMGVACEAAGWFHDVGKATDTFQTRLEKLFRGESSESFNHTAYGAYLAYKHGNPMLIQPILGHHLGMPNSATVNEIAKGLPQNEIADDDFAQLILQKINKAKISRDMFGRSIAIRNIFSCLCDADFVETEAFMSSDKSKKRNGYKSASLAEMKVTLDSFYDSFGEPENDINKERAAIAQRCRELASNPRGFFSLTVPTGGGKTLASMLWAINHAIANGYERIIYVIPYTSIVEQTVDVFRGVFGYGSVLEHHSNIDDAKIGENDSIKLVRQNWDAPIVVTTSVQFFESLFSNKPAKCRKIHNIANSCVILDEAQTLPLHVLEPTLEMMKEMVNCYNNSFLLCTATQPALQKRKDFQIGISNTTEIIKNPVILYNKFRRVSPRYIGEKSKQDIVNEINKKDSALVIVNSVQMARDLYSRVKNRNTYHLSSSMCAEHRSDVIAAVKKLLASGENVKLISTSLIEAGVDIDFPCVFRELSGIDSLVQSAGRCNREGRLAKGEFIAFKFKESENYTFPRSIGAAAAFSIEIINKYKDFLSIAAVNEFYSKLLWNKNNQFDENSVISACISLNFKDAAKKYRIIEDDTITVFVPYKKGKKLCEELAKCSDADTLKRLLKRMRRYQISLYKNNFDELEKSGGILAVPFKNQEYYILDSNFYSNEFGAKNGLTFQSIVI